MVFTLRFAKGHKFVLEEVCPDKPDKGSDEAQKVAYDKWVKSDKIARCYILASMSSVLQHQHQPMKTAYDIMFNHKELFSYQNCSACHLAMKKLMDARIADSTPVRDHVLTIMGYLAEIETLGGELDADSQIDIILHSLSSKFEHFKLNFSMIKKDVTFTELLIYLQAAELLQKCNPEAHIAEKGASSSGVKKKKRYAPKKAADAAPKVKKPKVKIPPEEFKSKTKCFKCGQPGHWKAMCSNKKKKRCISHTLVIETCLVTCSTQSWIVDTGATDHICMSLQGFMAKRQLSENEITVYMGNATRVAAVAVGDVILPFSSDRTLILKDCLYVSGFRRNLISVSKLIMEGYSVSFDNKVVIFSGKHFICSGTLDGHLYFLKPMQDTTQRQLLSTSIINSNKRKEPSELNQTYLWHLRLGDINLKRIQRLVNDGPLSSLVLESFPLCESCLEGKMTKRPFQSKGKRSEGRTVKKEMINDSSRIARSITQNVGEAQGTTDDSEADDTVVKRRVHRSKYLNCKNRLCVEKDSEALWRVDALRSVLKEVHSLFVMFQGYVRALVDKEPSGGLVRSHLYYFIMDFLRDFSIRKKLQLPNFRGSLKEQGTLQMLTVGREAAIEVQLDDHFSRPLKEFVSLCLMKNLAELKPSLNHIGVWGSPEHVLDKEADKVAPRTDVRLFVGYPRGMKGGLFYSPKD
ncbi:vacuolar fusion CCZ1-like protein [Perilla frutescens var. hirtella]|nr:vacuolar fusion CCZ1-like protein [Perilla frutescens var. hirtella]